jgi:hypothetical protein
MLRVKKTVFGISERLALFESKKSHFVKQEKPFLDSGRF